MASLFSRIFGIRDSKKTAKNRLQMVLVQDRSGLNAQDMEKFQGEMLKVIQKYFVLERKSLEIEWKREGHTTALVINTPIHGRPRAVKKAAA